MDEEERLDDDLSARLVDWRDVGKVVEVLTCLDDGVLGDHTRRKAKRELECLEPAFSVVKQKVLFNVTEGAEETESTFNRAKEDRWFAQDLVETFKHLCDRGLLISLSWEELIEFFVLHGRRGTGWSVTKVVSEFVDTPRAPHRLEQLEDMVGDLLG